MSVHDTDLVCPFGYTTETSLNFVQSKNNNFRIDKSSLRKYVCRRLGHVENLNKLENSLVRIH